MKPSKSNPFRLSRPILAAISAAFITQFSAPSASAATFYWDNNAGTAGFSTASGTWAQNSTTTGRWTTSSTGVLAGSLTQTTTSADSFNFGTAADGLGAGTITVSGSVTMGNTTFGSASGAIVLSGGTINYSASPTITVNNTTNTIGSTIGGAGTSFTKAGAGTLVLSGSNTFTGTTTVNAGTLSLGNSLALQNSTLSTSGAGFVGLSGGVTSITLGGLSGSGNLGTVISTGYGSLASLTIRRSSGSITYGGVIADGSAGLTLTKSGAGTQVLTGASTYTGSTTVSGGTLDLGGGTSTGSLASPALNLSGGSTFSYTRTGSQTQSFTSTNLISGVLSLSVASGNILNLGTITRTAGTLDFSSVGAGTVAADTASNINGIIPGTTFGNTWAVANGAGIPISGLANAAYGLSSSAGTTAASYNGANIDIDSSPGVLSDVITPSSLRFSAAAANTLSLATGTNVVNSGILVTSDVGNNLSTITGGDLTGAANADLIISQQNTLEGLTIASSIVDNASTGLIKLGAGRLTLSGSNSFTGAINLTAGTLVLPGANTISGAMSVAGTATLQLGHATSLGTSTMTVASGATIQLRNDNTTTFTAPFTTPAAGVGVTYNFDVNSASGSTTGKTLTLGNITFGNAAANTLNVTGGNSYALALGTLSSPSGSGGPWAFTVNATSAPVTIAKFSAGSFGNALLLQGGSPITLSTFEMGSNGPNSLTVGSATTVTLGATTQTNNRAGGSSTYTLNGGTLNINHANSISNPLAAGGFLASSLVINSGTIDNTTAASITEAGNPAQTWNGNFTFTGTSSLNLGTGAVSLGSTAGSRTVTVNANTLTVGGVISNGTATSLTKNGSGILALSGANTYNGGTNVNAGTLVFMNTAAKPATGTTTVAAGASLGLGVGGGSGFSSTDVDSLYANTLAGVTIDPASGIALDTSGGDFTYASDITSTRPLAKLGTNILTLSGNNNYTGNTILSSGTLSISTSANLGASSSGLVFDGGTLQITGTTLTSFSGLGHAVSYTPGKTVGLDINDTGNVFTADQVLSQTTGGLIKTGTGVLVISQANTFTGNTTIQGGSLVVSHVSALSSSSLVSVTSGTIGGTLRLATDTPVNPFPISGNSGSSSGTVISDRATPGDGITHSLGIANLGNNTFNFIAGDNVTGGTAAVSFSSINLSAGGSGTAIVNAISADVLVTGGASIAANNAAKTLQLNGTTTGNTISGPVSNGINTVSLTKAGSGTWTLAGANTHTGTTTVSDGVLNLTGNRTTNSGAITVQSGGTLNLSNGSFSLASSTYTVGATSGNSVVNHTAGSLSFSGGSQLLVGNGSGDGTYNLNGGSLTTATSTTRGVILGVNAGRTGNFNLGNNGTLNMTGSMLQIGRHDSTGVTGGTGIFSQTGTGSSATVGYLSMGGGVAANSGTTAQLNLSAGTFSATTFSALSVGDGSSSTINISGTADVTLPAFPTARGSLSTATITFDGGTLKPTTASTTYMGGLTSAFIKAGGAKFDTTNGSITISQNLLTDTVSTGGGLTKSGTNTLTLTGTNTYTGNTTVNGGTLEITSATLADAADVSIAGSASMALSYSGTDTIDELIIGGVAQPAGVYGSTASGAANVDDTHFSGTGTLTVTSGTGGSGYSSWALARGLDGTAGHEAGKADDPDGDGRNNLYEFAFDGNPLSGAADGKIVSKIATIGSDQVLTLTLPVRNGASFAASSGDQLSGLIDGIYYRVEGDADLSAFAGTITEVTGSNATAIQTGLPALTAGWTYRTFRTAGSVTTAPKSFMRAKVSESP